MPAEKLTTSAVASSTAADSATTSRILRLREGPRTPHCVNAGSGDPRPARARRTGRAGCRYRAHLVALLRLELSQESGPGLSPCAPGADPRLALDDDDVGALVDLVVVERLAGGR